MADRRRLSDEEISTLVSSLADWTLAGGKLHRRFTFPSFVRAFGFMTSVALIAESLNHHPDWSNVYGTVVIDLHTHDLGGISTLDVEFARRVDALPA